MSISQNYYLRRAFELECLARQSQAPKMQASLEDLARAFRHLAGVEARHRSTTHESPIHVAELETEAVNLVASVKKCSH